MMKRVVVTGMGVISPIGNSVDTFWDSVKQQKVGIKPIDRFDTTDYKVKVAGQVDDFVAKDYMDPKTARRMERFCQFAIAASKQAIEQSGLDLDKEDRTRIGVAVGSGIGGIDIMQKNADILREKGPGRVAPLLVPAMITNMAAGNVAIAFNLQGKNFNVVTACATGAHSIGEAYRSIQANEADVMVAGGTEASITSLGIAGFQSLTALSTTEDPMKASIPFDKNRNGFVMGEGAGIVVLESLEHAKARGANILAEVVGYGATCDAYHITSPLEDGSGAARAMTFAMNEANVKPEEVQYVNAHGTSTHHNDLFETRAIKLAFGDAASKVKVNSTKSMIGHLLGAAGAVEFITCVKSIEDNYIHATVGLEQPDDELDLDYCMEPVTDMTVNYAISNSLGFGGHNVALLVKKFED
ncbi:MAG: beta-ketoacyl-ACP synthase II [Lachnospiraceae bacterium]|nr:beta-ketoacyl-ACP synthase II [Lachnospiraceae bacterium]MEE1342492.1 beta-ketoacyl-ACP synthase II [Lachnospiraceae bacterium]